jgi:hypothetical protein
MTWNRKRTKRRVEFGIEGRRFQKLFQYATNVGLFNGAAMKQTSYGSMVEIEDINGFLNQLSTVATQRRLR